MGPRRQQLPTPKVDGRAALLARPGLWMQTLALNLAVQDLVVVAFHGYMWLRVMLAPDGADARIARRAAAILFAVAVATVIAVRGQWLAPGRFRALVYRLGLFVPTALSYFELRSLLPALRPELLDLQLLEIDQALFGVTPAQWLAQFNTKPVVEWFSFFYYSYFTILAAMMLPSLFFERGRRLTEIMVGSLLVCAVGHSVYTLVPGLGPYATLRFDHALRGGFWWSLVEVAVDSAGAQMDIFPSLHTAYPTFFSLFAFAHRRRMPYRVAWPILSFFAANIVIATMFLRWHWGIDVIAGLFLAWFARQAGRWTARFEKKRRMRSTRQPLWEPIFPNP